ncbi:unnamed protein product [Ceutorhynchus assimilis]|uniref:Mitochondrial assembly of ribosomal large subunit protein 1 n=1 Tax=Ceutorhynchus assimilis TaxID=467358 RepID=A0A9N9Q8L4_9CUCU|nr:unnamed protein product [Ceutorhynchus assimilis]
MSKITNLLTRCIKHQIRQPNIRHFTTTYTCFVSKNNPEATEIASSYEQFKIDQQRDLKESSEEILDVYKERLKYSTLLEENEETTSRYANLNLTRGVHGVYDIEDLIEVLKNQQAEEIFVASIPKEIKYVDYIVVVSGRSQRHMQAMAQFVKRVYKLKRNSLDIVPKVEGENSPDWIAMDMGNIALHIFSKNSRLVYDLDCLWAVGPKYDEEFNKKEALSSLLESHTFSLEGLEPAK